MQVESESGVRVAEGEDVANEALGVEDEIATTLARDLNTTDDKEGAFEAIATKQLIKQEEEKASSHTRTV